MLVAKWLDNAPVVIRNLSFRFSESLDFGPVLCAAAESEKAMCLRKDLYQYLPTLMARNAGKYVDGTEHRWLSHYLKSIDREKHPLLSAAAQGSSRSVEALLSSGCIDILVEDGDANTPVHLAAKNGAIDILLSFKGQPTRPEFTEAAQKKNGPGYLPVLLT